MSGLLTTAKSVQILAGCCLLAMGLSVGCSNQKTSRTATAPPDDTTTYALTANVWRIGQPASRSAPRLTPAAAPLPPGMVLVPGGETRIGSTEGLPQEQPLFWVRVKPFWMDRDLVTVAHFRRFVGATGYKTQAETFGDAGVFSDSSQEWSLVGEACWHHPLGPGQPPAPDNHPVTQVSWNDAAAYAAWAGKRLPSELEWEHAARNARNDQTLYPFGNALTVNSKPLANTWNGHFPGQDAVTDGFHHTSPVGYYGQTLLGLTDLTGNVWEWCNDWRQSYADLAAGRISAHSGEKVQRGGSFLCEPGWCHGYRVSGRSFSSPETALMHVGFRCVKSIP